MSAPPIPESCAHRPTTPDGLVIPHANVQLADGGCDFRSHHNTRWIACWEQRLCQVCGDPMRRPMVLLCGPRQLAQLLFDEPPLHPECALYVTQACPMVAGERDHYRTGAPIADRTRGARCFDPGCDCAGWTPTPGLDVSPGGGPAHEWYAVYTASYTPAIRPSGQLIGGVCQPAEVLRVRQVSEPGRRLTPWPTVVDWLDRYTPPETEEPT